MYLDILTISPAMRSRGVGSTLIQWGTKEAGMQGLSCWVIASEAVALEAVKWINALKLLYYLHVENRRI
jgi:N-acetylglutamate synthase-like GNAT family acetyltransferase